MNFDKELELRVKKANQAIEECLPKETGIPGNLVESMRYSVLVGGKRVRPVLMGELFEIFGGKGKELRFFQSAMELIHTASLCHDDLPALDNDLLRRGKKTTHAQYGEAMGILAGDALLNYAYELLFDGINESENKENALNAARILSKKSGYLGMLGGQSVDVEHEKTGIKGDPLEILEYINEKKTAALIEGAMMTGAALAGADCEQLKLIEKIGNRIGLAFQIQDDILDVTGTPQSIGKSVFSDMKNNKETYVAIVGIEEASKRVSDYTKEAVALADELPGNTEFLKEMISYLALRKN